MLRRVIIVVASLAFGVACSENNSNSSANNIQFERDLGGGNNVTTQDTGGTTTSDMGTTQDQGTVDPGDAGEEVDFAVQAPGFMHGSWLVARAAGGEIATLTLRHEAGETSVAGTYQSVEPAAFGQLGGSTWLTDTFTTSWTIVVDGLDQRFGLAMCARAGSDDQLACRFSDPLAGDISDATMTRQN